ncbi:hypothetical protein [Pseudogulbenkiania ferrooxidans]|uniref:Uncharacterized protein n=1 Tax=Pseudogulbenkiania ferrooxidans 2002 TaxID=279714 RepID=B9YYX8_9NEIS|nr:hypothetical protein [Pseudogulbenkiania ferrooxidans]EEG10331.1 hypothetical protein FuraDRAFT_0313 [Pseudogulbenkiania ferrooxidans 2002]
MPFLRKHLLLLCGLLAALWLFSLSAGMLGECFAPQPAASASAATPQLATAHPHHAPLAAPAAPDTGARVACAKHCEDSLGGVLKPPASDLFQLGMLILVLCSVVRLASLPLAMPARRLADAQVAIVGDPPPTIRFHRFNN